MEIQQVSDSCYAVLNEKNRVCDANLGLINRGGGVPICPGHLDSGNLDLVAHRFNVPGLLVQNP